MSNIIEIPNIANYKQTIVNGTLILTPIKIEVNLEELKEIDVSKSNILKCKINNIKIEKLKYRPILIHIYKYMLDNMKINDMMKKISFNMKREKMYGDNGYTWDDDIGMSMQSKDANLTLREIIDMIQLNGLKFKIMIKLENEKIIYCKHCL